MVVGPDCCIAAGICSVCLTGGRVESSIIAIAGYAIVSVIAFHLFLAGNAERTDEEVAEEGKFLFKVRVI